MSGHDRTAAPVLELVGIVKQFGATRALADASFAAHSGRIHALLGENGAGKTTLMRVAFGMIPQDTGVLRVDGVETRFRTSAEAVRAGIGMVQQHFLFVPALTVAENIALGDAADVTGLTRFDRAAAEQRVVTLGVSTGLVLEARARASELPVGAQQRLELVRALARKPRVLVLDEPTAVLTAEQAAELYQWLRRFANAGGAVVLITHKVREALELADDVTVLRQGTTVLTSSMGDVSEDAAVRAMVGGFAGVGSAVLRTRGTAERSASPTPELGEARISLEGVHVVDRAGITRLRDASLDVRGGEILGVIGIEGSGQRELVRVMAGRQHATSGTVRLPQRVGFVPEDRLHDALLPEWSLLENTLLAGAGRARGLLQRKDAALRALRIVEEFHVRAPNIRVPVSTLSGGNQQRFVLGREMLLGAQALVVENPTHGLDVRATRHVLDAIARAAHETNVAVVFSSSDTEEVLATADRVVVCFAGRVRELRDRTPAEAARALVGLV